MKICTYKPLSMADKKTKFNRADEKLKLLKNLKRMHLNSPCIRFLSSIMTLSILSMANSSFAFEAIVKTCGQKYCLITYWLPNENYRDGRMLQGNTKVEVLYCRLTPDKEGNYWCYLEGYRPTYAYPILYQRWVLEKQLCVNNSEAPLPSCYENNSRILNVVNATNSSLVNYYCNKEFNSPIAWFDPKIIEALCQPSNSIPSLQQ